MQFNNLLIKLFRKQHIKDKKENCYLNFIKKNWSPQFVFPLYSTKYSNESPKVQSKENSRSTGKFVELEWKVRKQSGTLLFQRFTVRQFICETLFNRTLARADKLQQHNWHTYTHTYTHTTLASKLYRHTSTILKSYKECTHSEGGCLSIQQLVPFLKQWYPMVRHFQYGMR